MLSVNSEKVFSQPSKTPYIQPNPLLFCIFCEVADHFSHECEIFKTSQLFWKKILDDRRCKNCLRLYHRSDKCYNHSFCNVFNCRRKDKHSPVICGLRYVKNYNQHVIYRQKGFFPKFYVPYKIRNRRCQQQINWKAYHYRHKYYFSNLSNHEVDDTQFTSNTAGPQCSQPDGLYIPPEIDVLTQPSSCEQSEILNAVENISKECQSKKADVSSLTSLQNPSFVSNFTNSPLVENEPKVELDTSVLVMPHPVQVHEAQPNSHSISPAVIEDSTNLQSTPALTQFIRVAVDKCSRFSNALLKLSEKDLSGFPNFPRVN